MSNSTPETGGAACAAPRLVHLVPVPQFNEHGLIIG